MSTIKKAITGVVIAVAALAITVGFGDLLEYEFPHYLALSRARKAHSPTGSLAAAEIASAFGVDSGELHWHTCSYCSKRTSVPGLLSIQVTAPSSTSTATLYVAYSAALGEVVAQSLATSKGVPGLLPNGERMVRCDLSSTSAQGESCALPQTWLRIHKTQYEAI